MLLVMTSSSIEREQRQFEQRRVVPQPGSWQAGVVLLLYSNKRLPQSKKVSSKSGARSKEPLKGGLPQIRIDEYQEPPCRPPPSCRPHRVHIRENKVAPQEVLGRLPTIKEYTEFITEKELEKEKSSSTRIRCAQKLVSQVEHHHGVPPRVRSPRASSSSPSPSPSRSPSASPSGASSTKSTPDRKSYAGMVRRESTGSAASLKSNISLLSNASIRSSASTHSNASYKSAVSGKSGASMKSSASLISSSSMKSAVSLKSSASVKSGMSSKSGISSKSSASTRSTTSTKSTTSGKSTGTIKSNKSSKSIISTKKEPEGKGVRRKESCDKKADSDKRVKQSKGESKIKALKKRFEGKEYHRLQ
ncbi:hypothetical protein C7M84_011032 [Penaeus vannamei]|uniref:Uncharacterized protein n=1 Tax=Penaeus vannamei TaxID=6689 RepID=A0A3R7NYW0_PENVA|nr:hypothetical protein C7M84_011032 [Penaeus vannamei]